MRKTLAVLATIASISVLSACGGSHDNSAEKNIPTSLVGEWYQVNANDGDMLAKASINPGSIQINLDSRDTSRIYWLGTFDGEKDPSTDFTVVSKGDSDAMEMSLFGSRDKNKSFTYKDGELSYKFTMQGMTSTIRLEKKYEDPGNADIPEFDDWDGHKVKKPSKSPSVKVPAAPAPRATKSKTK
ncbi:lipoprotein [Streptomyces phage Bing]|uniref:Lipoprotein n=1 Tax=Streptomyces phage Bing TaxID=2079427 RepID=A0A2L1IWA7_9CAUD|nr:lipoprotein [Streptomyces phage Bing]AVD99471.1 lipoprotein [Streptomyces phage Bing]